MRMNRRMFLEAAAVAGGTVLLNTQRPVYGAPKRDIPIGFQLYSLRGEFAKDVPGTLRRVAEIGYAGVEFWGYNATPAVYQQWTAEQLRKLLDKNGLKCCGIHLTVKALADENFDRTVKLNKVLGNKFLNVAAAKREMSSPESITKFAKFLDDRAERAKAAGMHVGYHCHPFDMEHFGTKTGWELLFGQTSKLVSMQLDMGNCAGGGGNPIAILKQFPGRAATVHIKEYDDAMWELGNKKYKAIFQLCEMTQPTQWYIVEQGGDQGLGFDIPRQCLQKLKRFH